MAAVAKSFKDAAGANFTKTIQDALGRQAAAESPSVALSTEDAAFLDGLESALATMGTSLAALVTAAQDNSTPMPAAVQTPADVISFTPILDTAAYAAGDVLFASVAIAGIARVNDGRAVLLSLSGIDKAKQKPAFTLFFYQTAVTSAAVNAANALSDADAVNCLGFVSVAAGDWKDLANNSFFCLKGINLLLESISGTPNVQVIGILDAGTPTFALGDLVLKLGVVQA